MSIKVCHVTSMHRIDDARIFFKECKSLCKKFEVYFVAPNIHDQVVDGVAIKGVSLSTKRYKRLFQLKKLIPLLKSIDAEVYHFHDPELIPIGLIVKRLGKKIIFDSHEDIPAQLSEKESVPVILRGIVSRCYALYESKKLKKYDAVVSVSPSIVDRLIKINPHTYQVTNFPIYVDCQDNRKWNKTIVFAGGVCAQWMHEEILDSIENLDVRYVLAGFADENYLEKLKTIPSWSKVDFKGKLKYTEIIPLLQESSAGMVLNDYIANVGYKMGSLGNTKLFEYMMAGIPVIATDFTLWKQIIDECDCGVCINPHDVDAIAKAITLFTENAELAKEKGDNGRKVVKEQYCWATQEQILFEMYDYVTSN